MDTAPSVLEQLRNIDIIIRSEDAMIVYLHKEGGTVVAVLNADYVERIIAREKTVQEALAVGVDQRLTELNMNVRANTEVDLDVLSRIGEWIKPGNWLEATRDKDQIVVTLHDRMRFANYSFIREEQGGMFEIVGATKIGERIYKYMRSGYGNTFWEAAVKAFAAEKKFT